MASLATIQTWYENVLQYDAQGFAEAVSPAELATLQAMTDDQLWEHVLDLADDDVAQIVRLYQGVLGRIPEQAGLFFWTNELRRVREENPGLDSTESLIKMAADVNWFDITVTPEFGNVVGDPSLPNDKVVALFYENVLDRAPDAAGLAYWTGQIDLFEQQALAEGLSAEDAREKAFARVFVSFTESDEYKQDEQYADDPSTDVNETATSGLDVKNYLLSVRDGDYSIAGDPADAENTGMALRDVYRPEAPEVPVDDGTCEIDAYDENAANAIGLTDQTDTLKGTDGNDVFYGATGSGEPGTLTEDDPRTMNSSDRIDGGAGMDALHAIKGNDDIDDGMVMGGSLTGTSIEVVIATNEDEEDSGEDSYAYYLALDPDLLNDLAIQDSDFTAEQDWYYAAHFWEDNGPDNKDPNPLTIYTGSVYDGTGSHYLGYNGDTEEENGLDYSYYDVDCCAPDLPLTKQFVSFTEGEDGLHHNPDWLELDLSNFKDLQQLEVKDSTNGVLFTDVQQNFWDTDARLSIIDTKADLVLLDSDLSNETPALNLQLDEVSLSHFVITENYEPEANQNDAVGEINIHSGGQHASVIGNIQNGVDGDIFLSGVQGLSNDGYGGTSTINVEACETSGEFIDGQETAICYPHRELCLNPELNDYYDLVLGSVVGLGDRLPNLDTFDASASKGDVLAIFAKSGIAITGGAGDDMFIYDELNEQGDNFLFTGTSVDGGAGFDQIGLFSDDLSNLENAGDITNVEAIVALEPVGYGDDHGAVDSPNDIDIDDPDLGDDQEGSLFNSNLLNDAGLTAADSTSPIGSNDPFEVDLSKTDAALQYVNFASGVDSDIAVGNQASSELTIEFNQACWDPTDGPNGEDGDFFIDNLHFPSSGHSARDAGGIPGSILAAQIEENGIYEGFDIELGTSRATDARVNLSFNVADLYERGGHGDTNFATPDSSEDGKLEQIWCGINEEDIDGTPNHVQSVQDRGDNITTLEIYAADMNEDGDGTNLFVDNMDMKGLKTLYLSDDGKDNGAMRVETGSQGNTAALTLIDGSRTWDYVDGALVQQSGEDVACEGDAYDQLLVRLEECDAFPCDEYVDSEIGQFCDAPWAVEYEACNDWLDVSDEGAVFLMGEGNDTALGGDGADMMYGNGGDDILLGGAGNDKLYGGEGFDQLQGGDGNDYIETNGGVAFGDGGKDTIIGSDADDVAYGGTGDDFIAGLGGDDRLAGGSGDDVLLGGEGADVVVGGGGNDIVDGDVGDVNVLVGDGLVPGGCDVPCYEFTVSGHIGDFDRFVISWTDENGAPKSVVYEASLGQTPEDVAAALASAVGAELPSTMIIEVDGATVKIEPCSVWDSLPDGFKVSASDNPIAPDSDGDGLGVDFAGGPDRASINFGGQTWNPGDVIEISQDGVVIGTFTVPESEGPCPLDYTDLDGNPLYDFIDPALVTPADGYTVALSGTSLVFVGPDLVADSTFSAEVIESGEAQEPCGIYTLAIDHGDVGDTLEINFDVLSDTGAYLGTVTVEAGSTDANLANGTVAGYEKMVGDDDVAYVDGLVAQINAGLAELGLGPVVHDTAGVDAVSGGSFTMETTGYKLGLSVGDQFLADEGATVDQDDMVVTDLCECDDNDVVVTNGAPQDPKDDDTQSIIGSYCTDPDGTDLFVAQSLGISAADFADGFDNDYIPIDYGFDHTNDLLKAAVGDKPSDNHDSDSAVDCWIQDWLEVSTIGDSDYDLTSDGADVGVRGVTYAVDFHSIEAVEDGLMSGPVDKLAFRKLDGSFDVKGTANNYSEEQNNAASRDDADANARSAFNSDSDLRYFVSANNGDQGGDRFLRVYYNEAGTDATPDAVIELAGYDNANTQFHYDDIDPTITFSGGNADTISNIEDYGVYL